MSIALMFPGQGSQSIGMLADLAAAAPEVRETFAEASEVLGYDLWTLVQEGPEERLNATEQTQPAMLAAGVAVWRVWRARGGPDPDVVAGHSLGEYSALVCAGSLRFPDAVGIVAARGRFMQEAVPMGEGAIAAVLGLDDAQVVDLCARAVAACDGRVVSAVNFNSPGQVVVAGHADAVEAALELARAAGAKRAVRLPMSVPVHCELMRPATGRLLERLESVTIDPPAIPVINNADIRCETEPAVIRDALVRQLYNPVRWADTVRAIAERPVDAIIECGPGRVLSGLARRIDRTINTLSLHDEASVAAALNELGAAR